MTATERDPMVDVAHAHAAAEAAGDIDATMATLDDEPIYELQPIGRLMRGRDAARRYYEHFFGEFQPRIADYELRGEWVTDEGVGQEYVIYVGAPGGGEPTRYDVIGILTFGGDGKLSGERIYASDELLAMMFGPLLESATTSV